MCVIGEVMIVWPVQDINGNKETRKYEKNLHWLMVDLEGMEWKGSYGGVGWTRASNVREDN